MARLRVMTTRRITAIWLLFGMLGACAGNVARVRGEVSWATHEDAKISECGTGRVLRFGTLASSRYFLLTRRYEELSGNGTSPVLAEVEGVITRSSSSASELTIEQPRLHDIAAGG